MLAILLPLSYTTVLSWTPFPFAVSGESGKYLLLFSIELQKRREKVWPFQFGTSEKRHILCLVPLAAVQMSNRVSFLSYCLQSKKPQGL